uniref:Cytochrome c biogenesis protein CcsA n=1 Tax=Osmundastrum cinnamomeum TaxID=3284 RepID=A0A059SSB5_OSMCI|nr:cytochrome c heme attachment protein [Osmundastrum cinnamomeum]AHA59603.1 cytochrome c heme attachment protein [Osmundastrum cinnamomeum]
MMHITMEHIFAHISFITPSLATLFHWVNPVHRMENLRGLGRRSMTIALIRITGSSIIRRVHSEHLPLSNLYESSMFLSWSFSLLHIILGLRNQNDWLGAVTAPGAMLTHGFATLGLPEQMQQSTLLVPAPQSHWLMMHVSMMLLSYATLLCGSLLAISSLVISFNGRKNSSISNTDSKLFTWFFFPGMNSHLYTQIESDSRNTFYSLSMDSRKCQLVQQLDRWSYRIISLGFPFLTIGILSGAVWANEAWGSYRSWDPKETWALITWLIYAIYLHTRMTKGWQGEGPAIVASLGFFLVRIRHSGVNLSGIGLHSYGWSIWK